MKVFVCSSHLLKDEQKQTIKSELYKVLKPYFENPEIISVDKNENCVYIMGKANYEGHDDSISEKVSRCVQKVANNTEKVDVKINYSVFSADFEPKPDDIETLKNAQPESKQAEEFDYEKLSNNYQAEDPKYTFEQVILPEDVAERVNEAIGIIEVESLVFDTWGLRKIIPDAASAISFYGPPGTGKTMVAEAIASKLGKKILRATYADIESKYHGEGPKMVKAIFRAAERDDAVLFLDESDSLLSKRLTTVDSGSSQAINSMRSQLLVSLENFKGIVIFATNLVVNYDQAFLSRLINIEFKLPDKVARFEIWKNHLQGDGINIPLSDDLNIDELAEKFEFSGRQIKNAVKNACVSVAINKRNQVTQADLMKACETTKKESEDAVSAKDHTANVSQEQKDAIKNALQEKLDKAKTVKTDEL